MKIKELIAKLEMCDPDYTVMVRAPKGGFGYGATRMLTNFQKEYIIIECENDSLISPAPAGAE